MGKSLKALILRAGAMFFFLAASITMFISKQKVETYSIEFVARDTDWTGLLFCAIVNISVCGYNLFVLRIPADSLLWKTVIFLDMIICILISASLGVGWQTYALLLQGNRNSIYANWSPVCHIVPNFCLDILISMIFSTIGFALSFLLLSICIVVSNDVMLTNNR